IVAPGLDSGNILFQKELPLLPSDTVAAVYDRLNDIQERELGPTVLRAIAGDVGVPQTHEQATYGCARIADDGEIDWGQPTAVIDRLIRALVPPFSGAFTHLDSRRVIVARAAPRCNPPIYTGRIPGRIV